MKIYHTETQEDYDALMAELEDKCCLKLKRINWKVFESQTVVFLEEIKLSFGSVMEAKQEYPNVPIEKYKAKQNNLKNYLEGLTQDERKILFDTMNDRKNKEHYHKLIVNDKPFEAFDFNRCVSSLYSNRNKILCRQHY